MALRARLSSLVRGLAGSSAPSSPWQPVGQPYPLLTTFEAAPLNNVPGLVAFWHLGVRPQWLKVALVQNLGLAIAKAAATPAIMSYRPNGDVYLAWARSIQPAQAKHVIEALQPVLKIKLDTEIDNLGDAKADFPLPPGTGDLS
ncbi:MAG: hypothetical protein JNM81_03680 [Rhodospirillaceae bacterium]|nr:hypothetical protein [Rhodospirillaceae bacterium]